MTLFAVCTTLQVSFKSIYSQNAVFPLEAFDVVIRQFCAAHDAGKPLIANLRTTTIENSFYGIPAGECFVFLDACAFPTHLCRGGPQRMVKSFR